MNENNYDFMLKKSKYNIYNKAGDENKVFKTK